VVQGFENWRAEKKKAPAPATIAQPGH
jgi:hypothetical protein